MRPVSSRFLQSSSSFERASSSPRTRAKERKRENEKENEREREKCSLTREFVLLVLSPFVSSTLSFFLLLSLFPLSRDSFLVPFVPHAAVSFSFVSRSLPLTFSAVLSLTSLSSVSLIFLLSPPAKELLLSRWFSYSASSFFFSSVLLFSCGWLFFHPSSHQRESISPSQPPPPSTVPPSPFSSSFFVPVDRGVLHSSNLNAGRTGVLYRLRK